MINLVTTAALDTAFNNLKTKRTALFDAAKERAAAQANLEVFQAEKTNEGLAGSNKEQREANLFVLSADLQAKLMDTETVYKQAALDWELAEIEVNRIKYAIRLASIAAVIDE